MKLTWLTSLPPSLPPSLQGSVYQGDQHTLSSVPELTVAAVRWRCLALLAESPVGTGGQLGGYARGASTCSLPQQ